MKFSKDVSKNTQMIVSREKWEMYGAKAFSESHSTFLVDGLYPNIDTNDKFSMNQPTYPVFYLSKLSCFHFMAIKEPKIQQISRSIQSDESPEPRKTLNLDTCTLEIYNRGSGMFNIINNNCNGEFILSMNLIYNGYDRNNATYVKIFPDKFTTIGRLR